MVFVAFVVFVLYFSSTPYHFYLDVREVRHSRLFFYRSKQDINIHYAHVTPGLAGRAVSAPYMCACILCAQYLGAIGGVIVKLGSLSGITPIT